MFFGSVTKTESPILRYITCAFSEELDKYLEIYEINNLMVDKEQLIEYIGSSTTIELKGRIINVFYKKE